MSLNIFKDNKESLIDLKNDSACSIELKRPIGTKMELLTLSNPDR
jgi:hypothetical protein